MSGFDGLSKNLVEALKAMNIVEPTSIQKLAIPQGLKGKNLTVQAPSGSGKTIAFLSVLI